MEHAWIVVLTSKKYNVPYYYGPFFDKDKATTFAEKECTGFSCKVAELIVVER